MTGYDLDTAIGMIEELQVKLTYQAIPGVNGFRHRLVDANDWTAVGVHQWVGYRTPAVWRMCIDEEEGIESHYVAVTDYFRGSVEFPDPNKIWYVCGLPREEKPQHEAVRQVWRYLEIFLQSIPLKPTSTSTSTSTSTADATTGVKTAFQRLQDFHLFLGKVIEREEDRRRRGG